MIVPDGNAIYGKAERWGWVGTLTLLAGPTSNLSVVLIRDYSSKLLSFRACDSGKADAHPTWGDITYGAVDPQPDNFEIDFKSLSIGHDNIESRSFLRVEGFIAADKCSSKTYIFEHSFPNPFFVFDQNGPGHFDSWVFAPFLFCRHVRINVSGINRARAADCSTLCDSFTETAGCNP